MKLNDVVERLATRQGLTEADIQSDVRAVLMDDRLELDDEDVRIALEAPVEGGRRIDIEAGSTVIEVKKDLGNERIRDRAKKQLAGYLASRTEETGLRYAGILTDGAVWELHHLMRDKSQVVSELRLTGATEDSNALLVWLEGVMATAYGIKPTPKEIHQRLGAKGPSFALDFADLKEIYSQNRKEPEIALKRELWSRLLASALGTHFPDTDDLFVMHTYLVISAELIAHSAVGLPIIGVSPKALLSGDEFRQAELNGVVEADFFDWPIDAPEGSRFVAALARRIARFDWTNVDHDILKTLYESVIDADTRKHLGEYYTPDWLAEGIVETAVTEPLEQRVLDPACGSGTFIFWAVRRYLRAAEAAGMSQEAAILGVVSHVAGMDLHPVAVALARVTYLLAIGSKYLEGERPPFSVPIYLGDSLRWEQDETLFARGGITIFTTDQAELVDRELHFPERVIADADRFDQLVAELASRASSRERGSARPSISSVLRRRAVHPDDQEALVAVFNAFCDLHDERRDHIWGYYVRNLARPASFTQPDNQVDVLVGNPPWLSYRFMPERMQQLYRGMSEARGLWAGGKVSTHQDLSDLFVVRASEQYLRPGGRFGFVMPAAVLSRRQFEGFRKGSYDSAGVSLGVAFDQPWDLRSVKPDIFPVPAAVVFGRRSSKPTAMPSSSISLVGRLARLGTRWDDATSHLSRSETEVAAGDPEGTLSPYAERFYQGAIVIPRVLLTVREGPAGPLGTPTGTRHVTSHRSPLEKMPWKSIPSLTGNVESKFLYQTIFGTNVAPHLLLGPSVQSVIPWTGTVLLEGSDARIDEYPGLAKWWREAEKHWEFNRSKSTKLNLREQLDYYGKLSGQFPLQQHRVLYTKSGIRIAAARLDGDKAIVDHTLYWAAVGSVEEGRYLVAILNSDSVHQRIEPLMSEGLFGKRHVDKYVFAASFPIFDPGSDLHMAIATAAAEAERIAAELGLPEGVKFTAARARVRDAVAECGITAQVEKLISELLG
ncbi:MAG TPA: N-6 DNA methylase [Solirubrobacterales bacterium]